MNRLSLTILLAFSLTACGFQLRGNVELPADWRALQVNSASPNSELASAVRAGFASNGIALTEADEANYRIYLGNEQFEQRNLTIGGNARAAEFELVMSTTLRVLDSAGNELLGETRITTRKVMTHDPENVTGKVEESRLLRAEMRTDLVQQVLRQVRFLATATPVAGR